MSFKRDGNDTNLLKNLQHRRVTDILGDHIPCDEASLLSNGRLTCTVCSKRPIFDTMQMLSLHRKGKKHLLELSIYLEHKRDLEYKKLKQTQKSFLKTNQITIKCDPISSTFIGYPRSYGKRKKYGSILNRKCILDIESCEKTKNSLIPSTFEEPSANSQIRKYLKSLPRKESLEKTVNKLRENYGQKTNTPKVSVSDSLNVISSVSKKIEDNLPKSSTKSDDYHLKLLESGWIKNSAGEWVKDPDAEFDSDEEMPPPPPPGVCN